MFLIFPVLLCWRLGSWGEQGRGRWDKNQYGVAGDLGAGELQGSGAGRAACSAALSRGGPWELPSETKGRSQVGVRSSGGEARYLLSNARNWEISSMRHQGSLISSFAPSAQLSHPPPPTTTPPFLWSHGLLGSLLPHRPPDSPAGDIRGPEPVVMPTQQI